MIAVRTALCQFFEQWGKPGCLRVDNGLPLGAPDGGDPPPVLALWLIAHDVKMTWNKPACPQMNSKVEHMQDTSQRWVDLHDCPDARTLQDRLDTEALVQRAVFPVSRLKNQTRMTVFPQLAQNTRAWTPQADSHFCANRVYQFLAKKVYVRKVSTTGQVKHFGQRRMVGAEFKGRHVKIKLACDPLEWQVFDLQKRIKSLSADMILPDRIKDLSVFQGT